MNLVADLLLGGAGDGRTLSASRLCPPMRRRLTRGGSDGGALFNADRLLNRFWDYPRWVRRRGREFDLFHVVDHSYAQLLHELPAGRAVVTCHDLDTFRCVLEPESEPRPALFRAMTRRVLEGFRRAARVACVSEATRDELLRHRLFPPERLAVIPNGIHAAYTRPTSERARRAADRLLGPAKEEQPELLHVGSTVARKRLDVLLETFARVRESFPRARLVRVGGLTDAQAAHAGRLKLGDALTVVPYLEPEVLACVYRRAALVLMPSEREGFGLPVAEALACGTPVVASRLEVLREVGGEEAVEYCPVGDREAWAGTVARLLREREAEPAAWDARRAAARRRASRFTREAYVEKTFALYEEVLNSI
jgi:glycosyltransferase involved in cell wall biosynthesis